jgi:hypothetical protein
MYVSAFHSIVSYLHVTCDTIRETEFVHSGNCFWIHQTTLVAAKHNITMYTFLSVCLSVCLSVYLTLSLSAVPDPIPVYLSLYLTPYLSTCLSTWPPTSLLEPLPAWLHTWMSTCLSVSLIFCLPHCLPICHLRLLRHIQDNAIAFFLENVTHNYGGKNLSLIPSTLNMAVVSLKFLLRIYQVVQHHSNKSAIFTFPAFGNSNLAPVVYDYQRYKAHNSRCESVSKRHRLTMRR